MPRLLKQDATYWGPPADNGFGGGTYPAPVALKVRWEDKTALFIDANGKEAQSTSQVLVGQDLQLGGYLFLGTSTATSPAPGAREIRGLEKIPNIKANKFLRRALL